MSKRYGGYGVTRFIKTGAVRGVAVASNDNTPTAVLCPHCSRYIPSKWFAWHTETEHPKALVTVPPCPKCEEKQYRVTAGEIGSECGNVVACDNCGTILVPLEYQTKGK